MSISVFDLFTIGIGPSSSHMIGPMRAANTFVSRLEDNELLANVARIKVHLYGSLDATGRGHGSDKAVLLGLEGEHPETVDVDSIDRRMTAIREQEALSLLGKYPVTFHYRDDLLFEKRESLPGHPNGMRFVALGANLLFRRWRFRRQREQDGWPGHHGVKERAALPFRKRRRTAQHMRYAESLHKRADAAEREGVAG